MSAYYRLCKPGIVYGNAMTALAGFLFASHSPIDFLSLGALLIGQSLVTAAACVTNNVMDRDIDTRMERTKGRAIPTGTIPVAHALAFATGLFVLGFALLVFYTNLYAVGAVAFGTFVYLALYTPAKRRTLHSTLIGAFAGAVPPVAGYVAVSAHVDAIALSIFIILIAWQMVHFFAIGIFRRDDYAAAGLPIMPVAIGIRATKYAMFAYTLVFALSAYTLYVASEPTLLFALILTPVSAVWLLLSLHGLRTKDDARWARVMFFYSIAALMLLSIALAFS